MWKWLKWVCAGIVTIVTVAAAVISGGLALPSIIGGLCAGAVTGLVTFGGVYAVERRHAVELRVVQRREEDRARDAARLQVEAERQQAEIEALAARNREVAAAQARDTERIEHLRTVLEASQRREAAQTAQLVDARTQIDAHRQPADTPVAPSGRRMRM